MWPPRTIIASSLFFASACAVTADNDSIPGRRLIISTPTTTLKPLLNSRNSMRSEGRRESLLLGLLQIRQVSACPFDFFKCPPSGCCRVGGDCCAHSKCCDTNEHCCSDGCCENTDNCSVDAATGDRGCCPKGQTCVKGPDICEHPNDLPCPDEDFCCPPGNVCFRDSDGDPRCREGSGLPPTTRSETTAPRTTSIRPVITTRTPTGGTVSSTRPGTVAGHEPTVYPFPSSSGSQSTVVDAADVRISWAGSFWILGPSSCNSTVQSKKTSSAGHSLAFEVTSVTSVYLTLSARNVVYIITVNGRSTTYTETSAFDSCKLTWSSGTINTKTSINITVEGSATSPFDKRQTSDDWSFEFHHFLMTTPGSSATASPINPSSSTVPGNAAVCFKAESALYRGLLTVFVVFLGLF